MVVYVLEIILYCIVYKQRKNMKACSDCTVGKINIKLVDVSKIHIYK